MAYRSESRRHTHRPTDKMTTHTVMSVDADQLHSHMSRDRSRPGTRVRLRRPMRMLLRDASRVPARGVHLIELDPREKTPR